MGVCTGIIKFLIVLLNIVFLLIGLVIVVGAVFILADPYNALTVGQDPQNYYIGLAIVLVVGFVLIIVAFLGCCGAFKESQCLLITFFCFLLIVVTAEIAAGAWAYTNKDKLNDLFRATVKYTVQEEYSVLPTRTIPFDGVQQFFQCCGADSPKDWASSRFNNVERSNTLDLTISRMNPAFKVPPSCCKAPIPENVCNNVRSLGVITSAADIPNGIYSAGCIEKFNEFVNDNLPTVIIIGLAVIVFETFGLIFALVICCTVRRSDDYKS